MTQDDFLKATLIDTIVYAVQPKDTGSARVYFLGGTPLNRVTKYNKTVYSRNFLQGTSSTISTIKFSAWVSRQVVVPLAFPVGTKFTYNVYYDNTLDKNTENAADKAAWARVDYNGTYARGGEVNLGSKGSSTASITLVKDAADPRVFIAAKGTSTGSDELTLGVGKNKIEKGSTPTAYTVAPEDLFPKTSSLLPDWIVPLLKTQKNN